MFSIIISIIFSRLVVDCRATFGIVIRLCGIQSVAKIRETYEDESQAGNRGRHREGKLAERRRVRGLLTRNCFTMSQLKV